MAQEEISLSGREVQRETGYVCVSWVILREYGRERMRVLRSTIREIYLRFPFIPLIFARCCDGSAAGLGHGAELSFRTLRPTGSGRRVEAHRGHLGSGVRGGASPSPVRISVWRSGAGGGTTSVHLDAVRLVSPCLSPSLHFKQYKVERTSAPQFLCPRDPIQGTAVCLPAAGHDPGRGWVAIADDWETRMRCVLGTRDSGANHN
ncbi:hypothetical protein B0T18DRAFT_202980 [Schizothecium vesticola]|uniref:Uncharacterized protein n=1 Tax=Schizothecium vesticola TaxID=314040 RepID=A0AA40EIW6_9PEZI|nr:hypothetical protein B0T18DRAFT_202980 [Schizothecium vesticola]